MLRRSRTLCSVQGAVSVVGALVGVWLLPAQASAQQNYRDVPIGGKNAVMGGVGTAAGNDSSMAYLNPAGLANIPGDVFALSAQVYTTSRRKVDSFLAPNGFRADLEPGGQTFRSSSIGSFPSSVSYMKHFKAGGLRMTTAFSLVVPAAQNFSMTGAIGGKIPSENGGFSTNRSFTFNSADYYIGPSFAVALSERIRFGASLLTLYQTSQRSVQRATFMYQFDGARKYDWSQSLSEEFAGASLVGVVGIQAVLLPGLSLGLGAALPSFRMSGVSTVVNQDSFQGSKEAEKSNESLKGEGYYDRPLRLNAGLWFERPKSFGIGADVHYHAAKTASRGYSGVFQITESANDNVARSYNEAKEVLHDAKQVINLSVGGEVWLNEMFALRAGFFTNRSPYALVPNDPTGISIDRLGGTLGLGVQIGSFETTIGGLYQRGTGKMNVTDESSARALANGDIIVPVGVTEDTLMLMLSAVVTTEEAKNTIKGQMDKIGPKMPSGVQMPMPDGDPSETSPKTEEPSEKKP